MNTRHTLAGLLALSLLLSAAPARAAATVAVTPDGGWDGEQAAQTEKFSKTVPLGKTGSVTVSNVAGNIVVTGGAGDQVVIDAVKRSRTVEALKEIEIEVLTAEGRVEIATKYPHWSRGGDNRHDRSSVDFTLTVPRGAMVRVKSVSGDVKVTTVDGDVRADSVSGDVAVSQALQVEGARSVSGNVTITASSASGTLDAASVSGDVDLVNVKARAIDGESVSGDMTMTDVTCDRVRAKSVSGGITFGGPLAKAGRYILQSHSGDVLVKVLNDAGFEVSASSFSGSIKSDLPLTGRSGAQEEGRRGPRHEAVRGTYGDGSAVLELNSFSGDIRITGKDAVPVKK